MIYIKDLTNKHIGSIVIHEPGYKRQFGILKSWNEDRVFVVYHYNDEPYNFRDYTGASTDPKNLSFDSLTHIGVFKEKPNKEEKRRQNDKGNMA